MGDQPDSRVRNRRRRDKADQTVLSVGPEPGQAGRTAPVHSRDEGRLMAARLQRDASPRRKGGEPAGLIRVLEIVELGNDVVARAPRLEVQVVVLLQVARARVQAKPRAPILRDEVVLVRLFEPNAYLRLPHRKAQILLVRDRIHHEVRVLSVHRGETRLEHMAGDSLRAGDADGAAETTRMPMVFFNAKAKDNPIVFVDQAALSVPALAPALTVSMKNDTVAEGSLLQQHYGRGWFCHFRAAPTAPLTPGRLHYGPTDRAVR